MNNILKLYIDDQKNPGNYLEVGLYDDEPIKVVDSIKSVKDISKIFNTFSRDFKIPASPENNILFKHYSNSSISNGFDGRIKTKALIQVGGVDYKEGYLKLVDVSRKNGVASSYKLIFQGSIISLKDTLSDDKIKDLDFSVFNEDEFLTNDAQTVAAIRTGLFVGGVAENDVDGNALYPDVIRAPIFTTGKVVAIPFGDYSAAATVSAANTDDFSLVNFTGLGNSNVSVPKEDATTSDEVNGITNFKASPVNAYKFQPSVKVGRLLRMIDDKYSLGLQDRFIHKEEIDQLYLLFNGERTESDIENDSSAFNSNVSSNSSLTQGNNSVTYSTEVGAANQILTSSSGAITEWTPTPTAANYNEYESFIQNQGRLFIASNTSDAKISITIRQYYYKYGSQKTVISSKTHTDITEGSTLIGGAPWESTLTKTYYVTNMIGLPVHVEVEISASKPLAGDLEVVFRNRIYEFEYSEYGASPYYYNDSVSATFTPASTTYLDLKSLSPDMKVIDLLTGIFKLFNLTAEIGGEDVIVDTLYDYYDAGNTYDITNSVDTTSSSVANGFNYKNVLMNFEENEDVLSKNYVGNTANIEFGDIRVDRESITGGLEQVNDGTDYTIKAPFNRMMFENLALSFKEGGVTNSGVFSSPGLPTDMVIGNQIDDKLESVKTKPVLFYGKQVDQTAVYSNATNILNPTNILEVSGRDYGGTPELVVNGSFDENKYWDTEQTWTISGGTANAGGATWGGLIQTGILTSGVTYLVTFDVNSISGDSLSIKFGTTNIGEISSIGTHEATVVANGADLAVVAWNGAGGLVAELDNISVRVATNLVGNGNMSSVAAPWNYGSWSYIPSPTTDGNIATLTVSGGDYPGVFPRIEQTITTFDVAKTYTMTALVDSNGAPFQIRVVDSTTFVEIAQVTSTTIGYEILSFEFTPTNTSCLVQLVVQGLAGQVAYVDYIEIEEITTGYIEYGNTAGIYGKNAGGNGVLGRGLILTTSTSTTSSNANGLTTITEFAGGSANKTKWWNPSGIMASRRRRNGDYISNAKTFHSISFNNDAYDEFEFANNLPPQEWISGLYQSGYENYILSAYAENARLTKYKVMFSENLISKYKLNDIFIVGTNEYNINSINIDLLTGEGDIELVNKITTGAVLLGSTSGAPSVPSEIDLTDTAPTTTSYEIESSKSVSDGGGVVSYQFNKDGVDYGTWTTNKVVTINGATTGDTSVWKVRARNEDLAESIDSGNFTFGTICSSPTLTVGLLTVSTISFTIPVITGAGRYTIEYKTTAGSTWTLFNNSASSGSNTITGLSPTESYDIRVSAVNVNNLDSAYGTLTASTTVDTVAPSVPASITLISSTTTAYTIESAVSTDNNASAVEYLFYQDGVQFGTWQSSRQIVESGLNPGESAVWKVKARDTDLNESAFSSDFTFGTITYAPALTLGKFTSNKMTIRIGEVVGAASYTLQYKLSSDSIWTVFGSGLAFGSHEITGLLSSTSYDSRALAENVNGVQSAYSTTLVTTTADSDRNAFQMELNAYIDDATACSSTGVTQTFWHTGSGLYPVEADVVFTENAAGFEFNGLGFWYSTDGFVSIEINAIGVVTSVMLCL